MQEEYGMSDNESEAGSAYEDQNYTTDGPTSQNQSGDEASSSESDIGSTQRGKSAEKSPRKRSRSYKQTIVQRKIQYNEAYRTLYNETVEDISLFNSTRDRVPTSQVGLSIWSTTEKEILFQKLASLGKDNVKDLAAAIGSKSETEVRQFILLLDQGLVEGNITHTLPVISAADLPSAFEVSKQSEDVLEEFADGLSHYQEKNDQKREKKRYLEHWLLNEDIAAEIEGKIAARLKESDQPDEEKSENLNESRPDPQQEGSSEDNPNDELEVPAAELLNLPNWLRLSQLFMHKSPDSEENWTNFITKPNETPSMYHTAFQDFHNLTISITSRLVQASIFQAMTRLRARDKHQPAALVNSSDVRAVVDMMGIKKNRRQFWGSVPRSHGLTVTRRYRGHSEGHTRSGVDLSLEDAEAILGVSISTESNPKVENEKVVNTVEDEVEDGGEEDDDDGLIDPDYFYEDSELWSEISDNGDGEIVPQHYTIPDDHDSNISTDEEDPSYRPANEEDAEENTVKKPRKRGASARRALQQAHDTYLEAFDQQMSRVEEVRMWDMLNVPPPNDIKDEEIEIPRPPATKRTFELTDWREGIEFEAQWEGRPDLVKEQDFTNMQERGERGRKRRRLAYEYLEKEGLVELNRPETNDIRKITRQERESQAAAAAAARIQDHSRSQSPRSVQGKSRKKSTDRRSRSYDSATSQMLAQDSNPFAKQIAKRLAVQEKQRVKEEESNKELEREEARRIAREKEEREMARKKAEERERKEQEQEQKREQERKRRESMRRVTRSGKGKKQSGF